VNEALTLKLQTLPATPGVYLFKDVKEKILYVGKAKVLKHRVRSYFQAAADLDPSKRRLLKRLADLDIIATDTEQEALILEANLIHQHQPPYNVLLRDDKFYLFIKITKEAFPRVFLTRRLVKDGSRYFGPYSSAHSVRATLKLLQRLFPHRGEKNNPQDVVFPHPLFSRSEKSALRSSKSEVGLPHTQYPANIQNIIRFLKGDREEIIATLRSGMEQAAASKHFERATVFRDQLRALERLGDQPKVYLPSGESLDLISLATTLSTSAVNVFSLRHGKLLSKNTFLLKHKPSTLATDIIRQFILQYYALAQDLPPCLALPVPLTDETALAQWISPDQPPRFLHPQRGLKAQLLKLGRTNAEHLLAAEQNQFFSTSRLAEALAELSRALHLPRAPHRVEIYDISNLQGTLATGSMAVFLAGQPAKQHYKKFRIRLANTPNDFAMLQEVLTRRFSGAHPGWPLPDLLIIDGGKGQLSTALTTLKQLSLAHLPLISLAKRLEEIFIPGQPLPLRLAHNSPALYLLQRMRDEAHRFTLNYHRTLRSSQQKTSLLDDIPGIGPKTKRKLLQHFGSLRALRAANPSELRQLLGKKADLLRNYL
jgi:excinuclease ABC subunit C